jgi:hypothetical protein
MPRRSGHDLNAGVAALLVATAALGSCSSGEPTLVTCQITPYATAAGSTLTLLPSARLDRVGSAFALTGADADGATARWASFDPAAGALGAEQALPLAPAAAGPWLRITSEKATGDTLLVAQAVLAANGKDAELHVVAVPASSRPSASPPLGPALAVIPGGFANGAVPTVALGASSAGPHAVLAWIDPSNATATAVTMLVLSAAGEPIGNPVVLDTAPALGCLAFAPGKGALTLTYHTYADAKTRTPHFLIKELRDAGDLDSSLELILDGHAASCPLLTPTMTGYAIAFQDVEGDWVGVYDGTTSFLDLNAFAAAVAFDGNSPGLAGLAPVAGGDFAVLVDRGGGGELWRLAPSGSRRSGRLLLPTVHGTTSPISSLPDSGIITATYADYSTVSAGVGTAGVRSFLGLTCM